MIHIDCDGLGAVETGLRTDAIDYRSDKDRKTTDGSVIRGIDDDYRNGPPRAVSVTCVIEVADNSLPRDLGVKLHMYARAGIGQYFVVGLVNDVVLDHRRPSGDRYQEVASLRAGDAVELRAGDHGVPVPVSHLLP